MSAHETSENIPCTPCGTPTAAPGRAFRCLANLTAGQSARIGDMELDAADASLLRAMGLRPDALVRVQRTGEPCIVEVLTGVRGDGTGCASEAGCWCRIGLARAFAQRVRVVGAS